MVLRGMETLNKQQEEGEGGRFEVWIESFEKVLDARGKMGSLVGASKDYLKNTGISKNPEEYLIEYGVSKGRHFSCATLANSVLTD